MTGDLFSRLRDLTAATIRSAGPRYSPAFAPGAPNFAIEPLERSVSAQCLSSEFRSRLSAEASTLRANRAVNSHTASDLLKGRTVTFETVATDLDDIAASSGAADIRLGFVRLRRHLALLATAIEVESKRLRNELATTDDEQLRTPASEGRPSRREQIDFRLSAISDLQAAINPASDVARREGEVAPDGTPLLLLGDWGTGKTHFVCDFALAALDDGVPAVAVLAPALDGGDPLDELAHALGLAGAASLLDELEKAAVKANRRALILIDAINEADRGEWRRRLPPLLAALAPRKNVAVLVTCRTPFDQQILTDRVRNRFHVMYHPGLADQEFDAQLEFFDFYSLPALHVPLLASEFARPLFLKLLCEGLVRLSRRSQKRHLDGIASGQKGMTYVLENFVGSVAEGIEASHALRKMACWYLLKGDLGKGHKGVAGRLAELRQEWLPPADVLAEIEAQCGIHGDAAAGLLRDMISSGLLVEQMRFSDGEYVDAVALPYQRFSDHLVARHLLAAHLDTSSESRLRRSFYINRRLGAVFATDRRGGGQSFAEPGIASALMVEFPERAKRIREGEVAELLEYLPRSRRLLYPFIEAFVEGLYWRDAAAFGPGTERLAGMLVARQEFGVSNQIFEVLFGLAARYQHPWNADWLWQKLAPMPMPTRDLKWSEFVRVSEDATNVYRLLAWAERPAARNAPPEVTANLLQLLALMGTTSERIVRDRATRAMVLIGEIHPALLFGLVRPALGFNDPYVAERVLAAAYGVALRAWGNPTRAPDFETSLAKLSAEILSQVLAVDAPYGTWHALTRSYAEGLVRVLALVRPRLVRPRDRAVLARPPGAEESSFREIASIPDLDVVDGESTIHMDFGNYTMGRLVDHRANYDMNHPEYVAIRRQIADRIGRLGYRETDFKEIDQIIARYSSTRRDGFHTDRYGKKYAWIAYFEMYGERSRRGFIGDFSRGEGRPSDTDIDPSFPVEATLWRPPIPNVFSSSPTNHGKWLTDGAVPDYRAALSLERVDGETGPWVLVDAVVNEGVDDGRETRGWVTSAFVPEHAVPAVRTEFSRRAPKYGDLPEPGTDYYTFAGEVPWSVLFGSDIRRADGQPRVMNDRAFDDYVGGRWRSGIRVEAASRAWAWEGYHSPLNKVDNFKFPSPAFATFHSLRGVSGSADLIDSAGNLATMFRRSEGPGFGSSFLYIRRDLVDAYSSSRSLRLVTVIGGERTLHHEFFEGPLPADLQAVFQSGANDFGISVGLD
jgi:hypothetical protein